VLGQRNIEFSRDVTLDEDVSLRKVRDALVPVSTRRGDDFMDLDVEPSMHEPDLVDEPIVTMDPLVTPCDPPTRKRPF